MSDTHKIEHYQRLPDIARHAQSPDNTRSPRQRKAIAENIAEVIREGGSPAIDQAVEDNMISRGDQLRAQAYVEYPDTVINRIRDWGMAFRNFTITMIARTTGALSRDDSRVLEDMQGEQYSEGQDLPPPQLKIFRGDEELAPPSSEDSAVA